MVSKEGTYLERQKHVIIVASNNLHILCALTVNFMIGVALRVFDELSRLMIRIR